MAAKRVHVRDKVPLGGSRERTVDGFLMAKARATRTGVLEYSAAELGVEDTDSGIVRVRHTEESVFHPETLRSLQNAVVTLDHPAEFVTPATYGRNAVGSVGGAERDGEMVSVDILLGAQSAIDAVEEGQAEEVSVGKYFNLVADEDSDADYRTEGPLLVNHVAVVERGRAGAGVRVLDEENGGDDGKAELDKPPANADDGDGSDVVDKDRPDVQDGHRTDAEDAMDEDALKTLGEAVKQAAKEGVGEVLAAAKQAEAGGSDATATVELVSDRLAKTLTDAVAPIVKQATDAQALADREKAEAQREEAKAALKDAFDKGVKEARDEAYALGVSDGETRSGALSLIGDAEVAASLSGKPLRDVMLAAVGDMVPNAGAFSDEALSGMLAAKKALADARPAPGALPHGAGVKPFGEKPLGGRKDEARQTGIDAYHAAVDRTFATGSPVQPRDVLPAAAG